MPDLEPPKLPGKQERYNPDGSPIGPKPAPDPNRDAKPPPPVDRKVKPGQNTDNSIYVTAAEIIAKGMKASMLPHNNEYEQPSDSAILNPGDLSVVEGQTYITKKTAQELHTNTTYAVPLFFQKERVEKPVIINSGTVALAPTATPAKDDTYSQVNKTHPDSKVNKKIGPGFP